MAKPHARLVSRSTSKRRGAQFSLVTLLVVVTVSGAWLAWRFSGVSPAWVAEAPQQKPRGSPPLGQKLDANVVDQINAAQRKFIEKQRAIGKKYLRNGSIEAQQEAGRKYRELRSEFLTSLAEIVEKHPEDEAVFAALRWLIDSQDHAAKAMDVLVKHHLNHDDLGAICLQLSMRGAPGAENLARAVVQASKSDEAKALALLGLGQALISRSTQDGIQADERVELCQEAEEALYRVIEEFPDVDAFGRTAGNWASGALFEATGGSRWLMSGTSSSGRHVI